MKAVTTAEALDQFRAALIAREIVPPDTIIADGRLRRCNAAGARSTGDAAYLLHLDGVPAGGMENWRDGRGWQTWRMDLARPLSVAERDAIQARSQAAGAQRSAEVARRHASARERAAHIWSRAQPAPAYHPYLVSRGVSARGLRVYRGALVIPVRDAVGVLHGLQFIGGSGTKRFLKDAAVRGHYFRIGATGAAGEGPEIVCVAEGFATGASIHEATDYPVAVAFHAGNLAAVAMAIRVEYPQADMVVCADDDRETKGNPGLTLARQAAMAVGGRLAIPDFGPERPAGATDFNDLCRNRGLSAVLTVVRAATASSADGREGEDPTVAPESEWHEPEPLTEPLDPLSYPVDALPPMLRDAVGEAQAFVQAPMALVACSALAALSVAAQGLVNVRRDRHLIGPVSLYLLAVADSGERKTTCDSIFANVQKLGPCVLAEHDLFKRLFKAAAGDEYQGQDEYRLHPEMVP